MSYTGLIIFFLFKQEKRMNDFGRLRAMLDSLLSYHRKITMSKDEVSFFFV